MVTGGAEADYSVGRGDVKAGSPRLETANPVKHRIRTVFAFDDGGDVGAAAVWANGEPV